MMWQTLDGDITKEMPMQERIFWLSPQLAHATARHAEMEEDTDSNDPGEEGVQNEPSSEDGKEDYREIDTQDTASEWDGDDDSSPGFSADGNGGS